MRSVHFLRILIRVQRYGVIGSYVSWIWEEFRSLVSLEFMEMSESLAFEIGLGELKVEKGRRYLLALCFRFNHNGYNSSFSDFYTGYVNSLCDCIVLRSN